MYCIEYPGGKFSTPFNLSLHSAGGKVLQMSVREPKRAVDIYFVKYTKKIWHKSDYVFTLDSFENANVCLQ